MKMTKLITLFLALSGCVNGQDSAPYQPNKGQALTSAQGEEIIQELRQIKALLSIQQPSRSPGAVRGRFNTTAMRSAGAADAPLAMIEFIDMECPFCQRFHSETFPQLKTEYIDTGRLKFFSVDVPLVIHKNALVAAQAGRCAGDQGQFWPFRNEMLNSHGHLLLDELLGYASSVRLDITAFRDCIDSNKYKEEIQRTAAEATSKGVTGTPTFVIGRLVEGGFVEGELLIGALPYATYEQKINAAR